jgi:hypothetical protein
MTAPNPRRVIHLLDAAALVVGYGMAALFIRAFWPSAGEESVGILLVAGLVYLWLGLAMSGPIVLLRHRRPAGEGGEAPKATHTWAELAWLVIGFYWLVMTALVVPLRMPSARLVDAGLFSLLPILGALGIRLFTPRRKAGETAEPRRSWTHFAALGLLASWPLAWAALILLGKTVL